MKNYNVILLISVLVLCLHACNTKNQESKNNDSPNTVGPYLALKPPGLIPEVIAPGIIVTGEDYVGNVRFSPDMKTIYFGKKGGEYKEYTSLVIQYENNTWQDESVSDLGRVDYFSKDGAIMYWENQYRERTESGWSELKSMEAPFDDKIIMGLSITDQKTIFFSHFSRLDIPDRDGAISYSRFIDGKYQPSKKLGKHINNGKPLAHPYIAPDESYLIWDAVREEGYGDSDLYISFKQKDGSWGKATNLGAQINTNVAEEGPRVTPDGKYLTFSRSGHRVEEDGSRYVFGKPYWVDARFIDKLRPQK